MLPLAPASPWLAHRRYQALAFQFSLRWNDRQLGPIADEALGTFAIRDLPDATSTYSLAKVESGPHRHRLYFDDAVVAAADNPGYVLDQLLWHVNSEVVRRTVGHLLIHAGAVAKGTSAVLLPAPTGAGKSTLVAGLIRAGFGYLSDEAAALDPETAWVEPYPRALLLTDEIVDLLVPGQTRNLSRTRRRYVLPPEALRPDAVAQPARVEFVVAPSYRPGAETKLSPISRAEAAVELGRNAMNLVTFRERSLPILAAAVSGATCYRLLHGSLSEAVEAVASVVAG